MRTDSRDARHPRRAPPKVGDFPAFMASSASPQRMPMATRKKLNGLMPATALPKDYRLEEYVIESVLGHGGFGITYLARDTRLKSRVAIKEYFPQNIAARTKQSTIIPITSGTTEGVEDYRWGLKEFLKEARALATFKDNHIVRVLRFLEANGTAYMVMDYEEGESLADYLAKSGGYLKEPMLLKIFLPILSGLQAVHDAGLLHLDIKPDNIYLRANGQPMLIDFGSVRRSKSGSDQSKKIALTPAYSAIEHYPNRGKQGPWTDVYSIGATLYRCITGVPPTDVLERYRAVRNGEDDPLPPAMSFDRPTYSNYIRECIDHALALKAEDRPQSAIALQDGLMRKKPKPVNEPEAPANSFGSGFIGVAKVVQDPKAKKRRPRGMFEILFYAVFLLIASSVIGVALLQRFDVLSPEQVNDGIDQLATHIKQQTKQMQRHVNRVLFGKTEPVDDLAPPAPVAAPTPPPPPPFSAAKVLAHSWTGHNERITHLAYLQNGALLASASRDGQVIIRDLASGEIHHTLKTAAQAEGAIAASHDGQVLALTSSEDGILIWNVRQGRARVVLPHLDQVVRHMAFSSDDQVLAVLNRDYSIVVWDVASKTMLREIIAAEQRPTVFALSPSGLVVAGGNENGEITYWSVATGNTLGQLKAHEGAVLALRYSPDGQWLASGGTDGALNLWATSVTGKDRVLSDAPAEISHLAFSHDNLWIAASSGDGDLSLWNLSDSARRHGLTGSRDKLKILGVSPDGVSVVAGGDKTVHVWRAPAP